MGVGFLIMQIGNADLDKICEQVFIPALEDCGLEARRVDKHNRGELLKSEIIRFIEEADIIVADLTHERPNCYLEIGYAMGINKFANLVLTCRDDHRLDSLERPPNGPKVHFDLAGYDILFWQPGDMDGFREELSRRIRRRLAVIRTRDDSPTLSIDQEWLVKHREAAMAGLAAGQFNAFMEVRFRLVDEKVNKKPNELLRVAYDAALHASGWPFAVVLRDNADASPKPTAEGIVAEVTGVGFFGRPSYDYWTLRRDGAFFLSCNLSEDETTSNTINFDSRIVRVAEVILYCSRLYYRLEVPTTATVEMTIKYSGLKDRRLGASNPRRVMFHKPRSSENVVEETQVFTLQEIDSKLVDLVKGFLEPLFEMFQFQKFGDEIYAGIVESFVREVNK